ncbi:MAG: hypothetical protein E6Q75_14260 [Rheinheimera sp.]|nr:MAG: hypothetical protein E6Q75_14260 [Rheinheimera sp.]
MGFWFKHAIALVLLLGLAVVLLFYPDLLTPKSEPTKVQIKTSAALEFTNFYEQLRYSLDSSVDKSKEFIIKLTDTSDQLTTSLESRTNTVPEMPENWSGSIINRKFEPGSKVREHMMDFARQEEMELYWTLPRDYVVKHYFQSEGDYLKTLKDIAKAIAPDFENPVRAYFCPKQRAAVLTDKANQFLEQNCQYLNAEETKR